MTTSTAAAIRPTTTVDTADAGITVADYLVADLPIAGKLHRASARTTVRLSRALRVVNFTLDIDAGLTPMKAAGRVDGDSVLVLTVRGVEGQPTDTQRIRLRNSMGLSKMDSTKVVLVSSAAICNSVAVGINSAL